MSRIEELYAKVYADPDDLELRLVLGDALLEIGDPRGELINLQAARKQDAKPSKRERELIKKHRWDFLGRIAPAVLKNETVEFELGFAVRIPYRNYAKGRERIGAPEWSTVQWIDAGHNMDSVFDLLTSAPVRKHARTIWRMRQPDFASLSRLQEPLEWRELGVYYFGGEEDIAHTFEHGAAVLPKVHRIALLSRDWRETMETARLARIIRSPVFANLRELIIQGAPSRRPFEPGVLDLVRENPHPTRISLSSNAGWLKLDRKGLTIQLVVGGAEALANAMERLVDDRSTVVTVTGHTQATGDMAFLQRAIMACGKTVVLG